MRAESTSQVKSSRTTGNIFVADTVAGNLDPLHWAGTPTSCCCVCCLLSASFSLRIALLLRSDRCMILHLKCLED